MRRAAARCVAAGHTPAGPRTARQVGRKPSAALYGVSMDGDGVSNVIKRRLPGAVEEVA